MIKQSSKKNRLNYDIHKNPHLHADIRDKPKHDVVGVTSKIMHDDSVYFKDNISARPKCSNRPQKHYGNSSCLTTKDTENKKYGQKKMQMRNVPNMVLDKKNIYDHPSLLLISNADPPHNAWETMNRIIEYHNMDSTRGDGLQCQHIKFSWLPNASWMNDTLSGYIFTVDGSKRKKNIVSVHDSHMNIYSPTPVVSEMFNREKILYGMLCIRLSNTVMNNLSLNPIESLEIYPDNDMDEKLREAIKDEIDLSSEGSYAGFYISEDQNRNWERSCWVVVSTGDIDISRTIYEYLKGDYNPNEIESKKPLESIAQETMEYLSNIERMDNEFKTGHSSTTDLLHKNNKKSSSSRRKKKRKKEKKKKSLVNCEENIKEHDDIDDVDDGEPHQHDEELSTTELLKLKQLSDEQKNAWRYAKLIKESHRLILTHAQNISSNHDIPIPKVLEDYNGEPLCTQHRDMTWENHILKEHFIDSMIVHMKKKRWLIASKLVNILEFDLKSDFGIDPLKKNIEDNPNVIHLTTNTFVQNKRTSKIVYYSGAFCKNDMIGGVPVPISPLQGICILKGSPQKETPCESAHNEKKSTIKNENVPCISTKRFSVIELATQENEFNDQQTKKEHEDSLTNPHACGPSSSSSSSSHFVSSEGSSYCSSDDNEEQSEEISYDENEDEIINLVGGTKLNAFSLKPHSYFDDDDDMGGKLLSNNESKMIINCENAFPFGTGRQKAYIKIPPPSSLDMKSRDDHQNEREFDDIYLKKHHPSHIVPISEWGPRGIWYVNGTKRTFKKKIGKKILFTWNDTRYPTHPRLAEGIFRNRVPGFQTRETNFGWVPTFGSIQLQPKAVILRSPINPIK